jgi:hypothetical protein
VTKPLLDNEEELPLFPATTGQNRSIYFGYVPVSSQETFAAGSDSPVAHQEDPRLEELDGRFIEPLTKSPLFGTSTEPAPPMIVRRISVYALLDLLEYFGEYLPNVGAAFGFNPNPNPNPSANTSAENALLTFIRNKVINTPLKLGDALTQVASKVTELNQPGDADLNALGFTAFYNLQPLSTDTDVATLKIRVGAALASRPETMPPPVKVPKLGQSAGDRYVLRYVYRRPQCDQQQLYISQPTDPFELAPFFDPDAPSRPIRIGLPVDVSIGGLRKFKKNVAFMMSKELRNKLAMVSPDTLKGDVNAEGGENIGHICSFSIPIITLCAFILLMIIVILLNIVFWWIPFLKICFPLNLKAKA